jgi:predicted glycogen debranching enzyme
MASTDDFSALGCMSVKPNDLGLDSARRLEWLLPNGLGGYSSSTVLGLNTRKYHGLLVGSRGSLDRRVAVEALAEEFVAGKDAISLSVLEYADTLDSRGFQHLKRFTKAAEHVRFEYEVGGSTVVKIVHAVRGLNALVVSYGVRNNLGGTAILRVRPLVNGRGIHEINPQGREYKPAVLGGKVLSSGSTRDNVLLLSPGMETRAEPEWFRNVRYSMEADRGEGCVEDVFSPGILDLRVPPYSKAQAELFVLMADGNVDPAAVWEGITEPPLLKFGSNYPPMLENAAEGFVVDSAGVLTVIAGYHWFGDWGRDTMISLPGLTLLQGRFDDAEAILARFIDGMQGGRIPTRFEPSGPVYYDFDGTLWMVDRLKEYVRYAGVERGAAFVASRWLRIRSVVEGYSALLEGGLVRHKSGTWMDTLERSDAVEVQALWYNALHVLEGLAVLVGDSLDCGKLMSDFESAFMDKYWNGSYLDDCLGDDRLRPNQVIAASLEYSPVPASQAAALMGLVKDELLTPCGLRTLDRADPKYSKRYSGGVDERTGQYHNGTVWPWLLGPYAKTAARLGGNKGRRHALEVLKPMFARITDGCMGTIAEVYDAEPPHAARGAVSQAWSVAEVLRAYREDAEGG